MILTQNLHTDLLIFTTTFVVALVSYVKWRQGYWQRRGVESIPHTFFIGHIGEVLAQKLSFADMLMKIYFALKKRGLRYGGFYVFTKESFIVTDLDLIKTITTKDFHYFSDHGAYYNEKVDPLSGHLFNLRGEEWKNLRNKLTPAFTPNKMKMFFGNVNKCAVELLDVTGKLSANNNGIVEAKDLMSRYTTDVIGSCAYGIECNSLRDPQVEFRRFTRKVVQVKLVQGLKNLLTFCFPSLMSSLGLMVTRKDVTEFFHGIVKNTVDYREANDVIRKDLIHFLIQLKNNIGIEDGSDDFGRLKSAKSQPANGFGTLKIAAQLFSIFIAGYETSMITATYFLHEMAFHSEIQERLRKEIEAALKKFDGEICYDAIMEMAYLDQCVCEILRKYAPTPTVLRRCNRPYKVPGANLVLDEGMLIYIPARAIMNDPDFYPEPEEFDPDRFSPENKAKRDKLMWFPFGDGPRTCIGLRLAMMQIKTAMVTLIKNYRFSPCRKTMRKLRPDPRRAVSVPVEDVFLKVERIVLR